MEAAGAARPACGQKPQLSGAAATCPASRGRVGPAGPGPTAARQLLPDPARAGPGLRDPGPRAPRGGRTENSKRTGRGAGRTRLRESRAQGPGRAGAGAPRVRGPSVGARDVGRVVLGHPFPLAPAGAEQWGSHKRSRGSSGGTPSPNTQGQTAGPHWPKHTLAPQRLSRAKVPGQAWRSCCGLGLAGLPPQRQPGPPEAPESGSLFWG